MFPREKLGLLYTMTAAMLALIEEISFKCILIWIKFLFPRHVGALLDSLSLWRTILTFAAMIKTFKKIIIIIPPLLFLSVAQQIILLTFLNTGEILGVHFIVAFSGALWLRNGDGVLCTLKPNLPLDNTASALSCKLLRHLKFPVSFVKVRLKVHIIINKLNHCNIVRMAACLYYGRLQCFCAVASFTFLRKFKADSSASLESLFMVTWILI